MIFFSIVFDSIKVFSVNLATLLLFFFFFFLFDILIDGVEFDQQEIVRTGWIVKPNEDIARFVTAYIRSRK